MTEHQTTKPTESRRWRTLYAVVAAWLVVQIMGYYFFTQYFT